MDPHVWLGFVAVAAVIGIVPGPGVLSVIGYAVSSGRRVALASVAGMALGNASAMTLSLAGVGALLAASALAFSIVKWAGALYLVGLGVIAIARSRNGVSGRTAASAPITARAAFAGNVAVGTFHPKTIVFFVAFVPQFMNPDGNYLSQAALLVVTFTCVVGATDTAYALAASQASQLLRGPRMSMWVQRAGGGSVDRIRCGNRRGTDLRQHRTVCRIARLPISHSQASHC